MPLKAKVFIKILFISFWITVALALIQLYFTNNNSYLGFDTQSTSTILLREYLSISLWEFFKVIIFNLCPILLSILFLTKLRSKYTSKIYFFFIPYIGTTYFLYLIYAILKFPALYENSLPNALRPFIHKSSFYLNPNDFLLGSQILTFTLIAYLFVDLLKNNHHFKQKAGFYLIAIFTISSALILPKLGLQRGQKKGKPHIFLLAIDSFRYDKSLNKSIVPNISHLAHDDNAISFHDHHIGVPRTFPSWVELLQGNYSPKTGIRHMFPSLAIRRYPSKGVNYYLKNNHYQSSVISDFAGDIFPRFQNGFDHILTPHLKIENLVKMGIEIAFPLFLPLMTTDFGLQFFPNLTDYPNFADSSKLIDKAKTILNTSSTQNSQFITIFFSTAHFPYASQWPWYKKFSNENYKGSYLFQKSPRVFHSEKITNEDIKQIRALYDGALSSIDHEIGRFIKYLKEADLYDNSLIIITADHGEDLYEEERLQGHGEHLKGNNVLKVPLIFKMHKDSSIHSNNIQFTTRSVDIMPTILASVGINIGNAQIDGVDLSPWLTQTSPPPSPMLHAYSETGIWFSNRGQSFFQKERIQYPNISQLLSFNPGGTGDIILRPIFEPTVIAAKHRSIISENYKLLYIPTHHGQNYYLYDRFQDPDNFFDIKLKHPKKFEEMKKLLLDMTNKLEVSYKFVNGYWVTM